MVVGKSTSSYFFQNQPPFLKVNDKAASNCKTICIIRANNSKEVSQMAQGVVSALIECIERPYIIPVVGNNNVVELTALLYDVVHHHPTINMIFSIGASSTKVAQKVTQDFGGKIPVFFVSVSENVAPSIMKYGSNVTGVACTERDYADQFKNFFQFTQRDTIKKVLVPCARFAHGLGSAYFNQDSSDLILFLASQKVEAELIPVTRRDDLHTKVKPLLSNDALLVIPRDSVLETYAHELITMANEQRVPLFSSSFESIEQGVAVSFGSYDTMSFIKKGACLAKPILVDGIHPSKIPSMQTINWVGTMAINREAARQQCLKLNMERIYADQEVMLL